MSSSSSTSTVSSGINWTALLTSMVTAAQEPVTLLQNQASQIQTEESDWKEVSSALTSTLSAAKAICNPSSLAMTAATTSNANDLTVTSDNTAAAGTYNVTVNQLATCTRVSTGYGTGLGLSASADPTQTLNSSASNLGQTFTAGTVTINGTQISINPKTDTLNSVIANINANVSGVTASYNSTTDSLQLFSSSAITVGATGDTSNFLSATGLTASPQVDTSGTYTRTSVHREGRLNTTTSLSGQSLNTPLDASGSFTINGVSISYNAASDSLNNIISRINANVPTVQATYNSQTDQIVIASQATGSLGISMSDTSGNFLEAAGLLPNTNNSKSQVSLGQNAEVTIAGQNNGNPIYSTTNTITNAVSGVTLTLLQADPSNPVTVGVAQSTSAMQSAVQNFVTQYNNAMTTITNLYNEQPTLDSSGKPVSPQTTGLLNGDPLLAQIKSQLSQTLIQVIPGAAASDNNASALGISLDPNNYQNGTVTFDTTKFNSAFTTNFQQAYQALFQDTKNTGSYQSGDGGLMSGVIAQLTTMTDTTATRIDGDSVPSGEIPLQLNMLGTDYTNLQTQITAMNAMVSQEQQMWAKEFTDAQDSMLSLQSEGQDAFGSTTAGDTTIGELA